MGLFGAVVGTLLGGGDNKAAFGTAVGYTLTDKTHELENRIFDLELERNEILCNTLETLTDTTLDLMSRLTDAMDAFPFEEENYNKSDELYTLICSTHDSMMDEYSLNNPDPLTVAKFQEQVPTLVGSVMLYEELAKIEATEELDFSEHEEY